VLNTSTLDPSLRLLEQFFASATQHASVAMCHWTNGRVRLSLDQLAESPLEEAAAQLDLDMDLLTMVVLGVKGDLGGQLILAFDDENGRRLAASLLKRPVADEPQWSELEKSAIMETGNILGSAYLNELTRLTDHDLKPTAPYFIQDFGASVLQQALMMQAATADRVLVCQTRFEFNEQEVNWNVFFVPSQELVHAMGVALHSA